MTENWKLKGRIVPCVAAFVLLAWWMVADLSLYFNAFWLMPYSADVQALLFMLAFWICIIYACVACLAPLYGIMKLCKVWDKSFTGKRLMPTLAIMLGVPVLVAVSYIISIVAYEHYCV